jgi:1-acyl-sn-glycerol-3-phosphate acyltransferase
MPSRSYVFAANHQSIYDIPIVFSVGAVAAADRRETSLGRIPFLGWHLRRGPGTCLVDRQNPGAGIVKKMAKLAGERHSLIVFSRKGTRSRSTAGGPRFKADSFVFALDAGMPVVPVSIAGSRHVDEERTADGLPRRGDALTVHQTPIDTAGHRGATRVRELAERVRDVVRQDVDEQRPRYNHELQIFRLLGC